MRSVDWSATNDLDYAGDKLTVTITLAEYRELVGKAALYDTCFASERGGAPSLAEVEEADADAADRD